MTAATSPVRFEVVDVACRWCGAPIIVQLPPGLGPAEQLAECERQADTRHDCPERRTVHVVSTGLNALTKAKCLASVAKQEGVAYRHHYVEAGDQDPPQNVITNLASVIRRLPPEAIVVLLDGDDWLAHPHALARVKAAHDAGAWVTYGSFEFADGRQGFAAPIDPTQPIRAQSWRTTHLKTIRAGLFQRLRSEDLEWPDGAAVPWDVVIMCAAIEQAGVERATFIPEVLYVYSLATSHEWKHGPAEERALEREIRSRSPYARIEAL